MLQFLKYVFATVIGLGLFMFLGIVFLIILASSGSKDEAVEIKNNSVLRIDLNRPIAEYRSESENDPFEEIFGGNEVKPIGLIQLKKAIANAAKDPQIKGIYLESAFPGGGYAQLEEIRKALIEFKKTKKPIYTYGEFYGEKGYYVASVADKIYLNPAGVMEFNGFSAQYTFYKGTFEKLGVKPVIFRVGEFKSAVEPFILDKMSDANKLQNRELLSSIQQHIFGKIAEARGFSVAHLNNVTDSLASFKPSGALKSKMVTNVAYYDEFESSLKKAMGIDTKKIDYVGVSKYLKSVKDDDSNSDNDISIIVASGDITSGESDEGTIGSETIVEQLQKARENDDVKAVVLRIDSPGGSALASDVMWREIMLTKAKKPVVASMSDVAASGGYYMAMACNKIVAEPTTITGSIGIFGMFFTFEDFLKNKIGVTTDGVSTNAHSDFPSVNKQPSEFEYAVLQKSVEEGYATFTTKAAEGRKMSVEKLRSLASGRVWTGAQAKDNGLVDALGGLDEAVKMAASEAKLKDYQLRFRVTKKTTMERIFGKAAEEAETRTLKANFGEMAPYIKQIQRLQKMQGVQARMATDLTIE
jgi:protease IV